MSNPQNKRGNDDNQPIDWSKLSTAERNRLIDIRVMGNPEFCPGHLVIKRHDNPSKTPGVIAFTYWTGQCTNCEFGRSGRAQDDFPKQHAPQFEDSPNYCEDMNAAWLIVLHFVTIGKLYGFICECRNIIDEHLHMSEWAYSVFPKLTPELIGLASLKTVGVEVQA